MNKITLTLMTYSALLAGGGLFGYLKAGSLASLIMSGTFAILILLSIYINKESPAMGYKVSYGLLAFLSAFFLYRTVLTGKFMPAGMLAIITLGVIGLLFLFSRKAVEG